jgi:hypothetical protein
LAEFGALTGNLNIGWTAGQKYSGKHLFDEGVCCSNWKGKAGFFQGLGLAGLLRVEAIAKRSERNNRYKLRTAHDGCILLRMCTAPGREPEL